MCVCKLNVLQFAMYIYASILITELNVYNHDIYILINELNVQFVCIMSKGPNCFY